MQKLLVIDGNAIVHRAYHAYPPSLTTKDGEPINAVYGWFAMLIKVLEEVKPDYLVVCFDRPAPTFRKQLYAGYQADRPTMADGLSDQIKKLQHALEEIGIPVFGIDGYEADDLIGTIAVAAKEKGVETIILSGDRDLLQLVNGQVKMLAPVTGITKFIIFDGPTVKEKYGVKPSQVRDYKALVGDNSDGYPGVTGIGPKTAIGLLEKYESLESLYEHLADLPEKVQLRLATDAEQSALAKKLATIITDAPLKLSLEACNVEHFTQEKVLAVFDGFGFNSIKQRVGVFKKSAERVQHAKKKHTSSENQLELI
jgi:DNA polymerase-1